MKSLCFFQLFQRPPSLPVRGAWIEMCYERGTITPEITSLPVRGAWIEMHLAHAFVPPAYCRSPCGERGLKFDALVQIRGAVLVAPRAGSVD